MCYETATKYVSTNMVAKRHISVLAYKRENIAALIALLSTQIC